MTYLFRSIHVRTAAVLYLLVSLLCTQFPLLNYLGYEFSAALAVVAAFVSAFITVGLVKRALADSVEATKAGRATAARSAFHLALQVNLMLLVIPAVVMATNALFVRNCSLLEGLGFFLLIPVVTVVFSSALGFFCAAHYRYAKTVFALFVLISFAEVIAVGYFTPAIFSYNFFYGYFPGLTYDEVLGISTSLVAFRIITFVLTGAIVWMARLILEYTEPDDPAWDKGFQLLGVMVQGRNVYVTAALATLIIVTWWFRGELGFDSTSRFIQRSLGAQVQTDHFTIYYSQESYPKDEILWIAAEHEFRLKQVSDALHVLYRGRIESYIYPSREVKQRLMGAGNTNIAKPWSGQIHITKQSLDATLKHELVHVVAAPFGMPVINASLSTGLVEGLAMAIEWDWGSRTPHQYAAAMRKFGVGPDISSLMSLYGFASQASSVSYVLAGSFCRYLIDTYGIRNMMLLYRTNDYEAVFAKPLTALIAEWHEYLGGLPVEDQERDVVDVLFRRPPIFRKVCARVAAARNLEARTLFGEKQYEHAQTLYQQSYDETGSYEAMSGVLSSALRQGKYHVLTSALDSTILKDDRPAQFLPLYLTIGDALWATGNRNRALELYDRVRIGDFSDAYTEAATIRRLGVRDSVADLLSYVLFDGNDTARVSMLQTMARNGPQQPVIDYLTAKSLARLHRFNEAIRMAGASDLAAVDPLLEAGRLKTLGYALFRTHRFQEAKTLFWRSLNFVSSDVATNEVYEWVERCDWVEKYYGGGRR